MTLGATMALGLSAATAMAANEPSGPDALVATITRVAPANREGVRVQATHQKGGAYSATGSASKVDIPGGSSGTVVLTSGMSGRKVGVKLPAGTAGTGELAGDGSVVYGAHDSGIKTAVQSFTDSVRLVSVMTSRPVADSLTYDLDVPAGGRLAVQSDGSVMMLSANGSLLGGIAPPWARDANGVDVPTHYAVNGSTLVQYLDLTPPTVAYPVVADPYFFIDLIDHATWVYHTGYGWTLQVSPTAWGRANSGAYAIGAFAWDELYTKYKNHGLCCNLNGMRDQLICHWQFAFWRNTYNLDEWRPDVGWFGTVNASCNPGGSLWFD